MSFDPTANGELEPASLPAAGPVRVLEPTRRLLPALPMSRALVVASGGFVAGLVALVSLRALRTRRRLRAVHRGKDKQLVTRRIVGKRSFLIDVHLLGK